MTASTETTTVIATTPSRGWLIGFGIVTAVAGICILVWPKAAVATVAVIVGLQLIVVGIIRMVTAVTQDIESGGLRALYLFLGLLLLIVGILCLRAPFHTAAVLVLLFGVSWIVNGVIEVFSGFTGGGGWIIVSGAVSLVAGIVVLAYPAPSALAIVWLFGISLIAIGLVATIGAIMARPKESFATGEAESGRG
jgi:uncharacterized membrane protein HdeD (DUF308 family)